MDDLSAAMAGGLQVTHAPNTTAAPHPRFQGYYKTRSILNQEERRRRILQKQKENRLDYLLHVRNLAEDKWEEGDYEDEHDKTEAEPMEVQEVKIRKPGKRYKDQLMLSEWMLEVPENFDTEWVMVPCPVGRRNLVMAVGGQTRVYTKNGYNLLTFPSRLPGGSRSQPKHRDEMTILDCVYSELNKTFYVLDMMCWKYQPIYDSDTEFRLYWMNSKLEEEPSLGQLSRTNQYRFEPLPNFKCSKDNIGSVLGTKMSVELDGLLFYHRHTHYTFGSTPLVLWLKAYMLPEILGIPVTDELMAKKPESYSDFSAHSADVKQRKEMSEKDRKKTSNGGDQGGGGLGRPQTGGDQGGGGLGRPQTEGDQGGGGLGRPQTEGQPTQAPVITPGRLHLSPQAMALATQGAGGAGGGGKKKKKKKSKGQQGQHQPMESVSSDLQKHHAQQIQQQFQQRQSTSSQHFGQHQFGQANQPQTIGDIFLQQAQQCPASGKQTVSVSQQTGCGGQQTGYGGQETGYGGQQTGSGGQQMGYGGQQTGYGGQQTGYGGQQTGYGGQQTGYGGQQMGQGAQEAYVFGSTAGGEIANFTFSSPVIPQ